MNPIFSFLERHLMVLSGALSQNKLLMAIKDAFILGIPFTVVGSFSGLIKMQLQYFAGDAANAGLLKIIVDMLGFINHTSLGLIGIVIVLASSYFYAKSLNRDNPKLNPFMASIVSLMAYMLTIPTKISGAEGVSLDGYAMNYFNYEGMFAGLLIGLITTGLYNRLSKSKFTITLHESVPPAIMESFLALIPLTVVMSLFAAIKLIVAALGYVSLQAMIQALIMAPLMSVGTGLPAILIVILLMQLLWFFGLHGFSIMWGVISALWLPLFLQQVDLFSKTQDVSLITQVAPNTISNIYAMIGGSGSTLALIAVLLLLAKKDSAERAVAKMSSVPGLFNINEPIIFGLPIVLNPTMFIPFIGVPLVNAVIAYFAISSGMVAPMVVLNAGVEPVLLNAFVLGNFNITPVLMMLSLFVLDMFIYAPFVRIMLKQRAAEQQKQEAEQDEMSNVTATT